MASGEWSLERQIGRREEVDAQLGALGTSHQT